MVNRKAPDMDSLFRALADRTRLRLINLMGGDEVCVCYFVEALKTSQPKISRHLAYLRRAGVVQARREGKWIHYKVVDPDDPHQARVFKGVREWLAQDPEMRRDRERLMRCCGPRSNLRAKGAPVPSVTTQAPVALRAASDIARGR
jgi:ArsR family transcriptional regulator